MLEKIFGKKSKKSRKELEEKLQNLYNRILDDEFDDEEELRKVISNEFNSKEMETMATHYILKESLTRAISDEYDIKEIAKQISINKNNEKENQDVMFR
jgi:phosphopantetheinyl transferase (holo-ACP synthase)